MSGLVREKVEVDHFPGDRDSVYIRISFPFKSYIGALADKENEQGISTARLPALLSPLKTDKALKAVGLAPSSQEARGLRRKDRMDRGGTDHQKVPSFLF